MCAVLDRNVPYWKIILYDRLGLPKLAPLCRALLVSGEKELLERRRFVHSEDYRKMKLKERETKWKPTPQQQVMIRQIGYEMKPNFHK